MKLQKLFKEVNWNCVWKRMVELYPDQSDNHDGYKSCIDTCLQLDATPYDMRIVLKTVSDGVEVSGCNGKTIRQDADLNYNTWMSDEQLDQEVTYALDFTSWDKWMGMDVDESNLKEFTPVDIVVHCLWEMTFVSFNQTTTSELLKSIKDDVKKIESGEMKTYTTEEVMEIIKNKFKKEDER